MLTKGDLQETIRPVIKMLGRIMVSLWFKELETRTEPLRDFINKILPLLLSEIDESETEIYEEAKRLVKYLIKTHRDTQL